MGSSYRKVTPLTTPDDINLGDCQDFFLEVVDQLNVMLVMSPKDLTVLNYRVQPTDGLALMRALYNLRSALDLPCDQHGEHNESCQFCLMLCAPCEQ